MIRPFQILQFAIGVVLATAPFAHSSPSSQLVAMLDALYGADVIFLGEQHDNPHHHAAQAGYVKRLEPTALVFEMLTAAQAAKATPDLRADAVELEAALEWNASGWPDFAMYYQIFDAAPDAVIFGAGVPRDQLREVVAQDLAQASDAELVEMFDLMEPLPEDQQKAREALQRESHCNALPEDMLPGMVNVQRLRDASLADAALKALEKTGGPVVVITGNGHARQDWGAPFLLQQAEAGLKVFALGQGEDGSVPEGMFEIIVDGPSVDRGDPCDAFK